MISILLMIRDCNKLEFGKIFFLCIKPEFFASVFIGAAGIIIARSGRSVNDFTAKSSVKWEKRLKSFIGCCNIYCSSTFPPLDRNPIYGVK